jgi:hypothetical protein
MLDRASEKAKQGHIRSPSTQCMYTDSVCTHMHDYPERSSNGPNVLRLSSNSSSWPKSGSPFWEAQRFVAARNVRAALDLILLDSSFSAVALQSL